MTDIDTEQKVVAYMITFIFMVCAIIGLAFIGTVLAGWAIGAVLLLGIVTMIIIGLTGTSGW